MKKTAIICATALSLFAFASHGSAQIVTFFTDVGPDQSTVTFEKVDMFAPITDPTGLAAFFTGSLADITPVATSSATTDLTETITLEDVGGTTPSMVVATYNSGVLSAPTIGKTDSFNEGSNFDTTYFGTFNEIVFDVSGPLNPDDLALFQGGFNFDVVPEPSAQALVLCGLGFLVLVIRQRRFRPRAYENHFDSVAR